MGVASDIVASAEAMLNDLGLEQSNAVFNLQRVPATVRNKHFLINFEGGIPDFEKPAINKKFFVERTLRIRVIFKLNPAGSGKRVIEQTKEAYDIEEQIARKLMKLRLEGAHFETLENVITEPVSENGTDWLVTTVDIRVKYQLDL